MAKGHSQYFEALETPVNCFVAGMSSPVKVTERNRIYVENNCCIRIAIVVDHFLLGYEVCFQMVFVDFDIPISSATILSGNPNYLPSTQRNRKFLAYTRTVQIFRIPLKGEWLRFLNRTIRALNGHANFGNGLFFVNHSEGKVNLQKGVVIIYILFLPCRYYGFTYRGYVRHLPK